MQSVCELELYNAFAQTYMELCIFQGLLRMHLLAGQNLVPKDNLMGGMVKGKSDPFVKINIGGETFTSHVIKSNLNPTWNEMYEVNNRRLFIEMTQFSFNIMVIIVKLIKMFVFLRESSEICNSIHSSGNSNTATWSGPANGGS